MLGLIATAPLWICFWTCCHFWLLDSGRSSVNQDTLWSDCSATREREVPVVCHFLVLRQADHRQKNILCTASYRSSAPTSATLRWVSSHLQSLYDPCPWVKGFYFSDSWCLSGLHSSFTTLGQAISPFQRGLNSCPGFHGSNQMNVWTEVSYSSLLHFPLAFEAGNLTGKLFPRGEPKTRGAFLVGNILDSTCKEILTSLFGVSAKHSWLCCCANKLNFRILF